MNLQEKKVMSLRARAILFRITYSIAFVVMLSVFIKLSIIEYGEIALILAVVSLFFISDKTIGIAIKKTEYLMEFMGKKRFYMCSVFVIGLTEFITLSVVVLYYHSQADTPAVNLITDGSFILSSLFGYLIYRFKVKFFYKFCGFGEETKK